MSSSRFTEREVDSSRNSTTWRTKLGLRSCCNCGVYAPVWTSWTLENPGRRFIGCPNYKSENSGCGFFEWCDPELTERGKKVILSLRGDCMRMKYDEKTMRKELENRNQAVEDDGKQRLQVKIAALKVKNKRLKQCVRALASREKLYLWAIVVVFIIQLVFGNWYLNGTGKLLPLYLK